jgi:hypothetical protein
MITEKVTKEMLMKLKVGEQKVFTLPSWDQARSGQSYAHQMKRMTVRTGDQREFKAQIGDTMENGQTPLIVTRLA